ncbi:alpha/beta fold hydrolase [Arthrobacter sp. NyZ413]|uniref:alpha/beta fold hydrolase n=1 Tax=Arthrobacter sp. NyZ413 TaxID=3144669 RepID=UPI003BF88824
MPHATTPTGTTLAYEVIGPESGEPLILLNGTGAQLIGWRLRFRERLASLNFRVYAIDNRDVGGSQKFPGVEYDLRDLALDTVGFLDALGIPAAHVVGQSMGGMIAQEMAIDHGQRILSLGLLYTSPEYGTYNRGADLRKVRDSLPNPTTREEAADIYLINEEACASTRFPRDVQWLRELGGIMWDRGIDAEAIGRQRTAIGRSRSRTDLLARVDIPTLVVHGKADQLLDYHGSIIISEQIEGSDLYLVAGLGHEINAEVEARFVELIQANALRGSLANAPI